MSDQDDNPDAEAVRGVLRYFIRHPRAVDDLEGIARWRLADEAICNKVEETHRALTWLVESEYLVRTPTSGSTAVFSLNPAKVDAATAFVDGDSTADKDIG